MSHTGKILTVRNRSYNASHDTSVENSDETHKYESGLDETASTALRNELQRRADDETVDMTSNASNESTKNTASISKGTGIATDKPRYVPPCQNGCISSGVQVRPTEDMVLQTNCGVVSEVTDENCPQLEVLEFKDYYLLNHVASAPVSGKASENSDVACTSARARDCRQNVGLRHQSKGFNPTRIRECNGNLPRQNIRVKSPTTCIVTQQNGECGSISASVNLVHVHEKDVGKTCEGDSETNAEAAETIGYLRRNSALQVSPCFISQSNGDNSAAASEGSDSLTSRKGTFLTRMRRMESASAAGELNVEA
jgi:hypothetical protein